MRQCPSCHGRGTVLVLLPGEEDEEAECLTCEGTGLFPLRCAICGEELIRSVIGEWTHEEPLNNTHLPRIDQGGRHG